MDKLFTPGALTVFSVALGVSANVPPPYKHGLIFSLFRFLSVKSMELKRRGVSTAGDVLVYLLNNQGRNSWMAFCY